MGVVFSSSSVKDHTCPSLRLCRLLDQRPARQKLRMCLVALSPRSRCLLELLMEAPAPRAEEQGDEFEAEETLPRVSWPKAEVRSYRGRQWLQRLLNTLQESWQKAEVCISIWHLLASTCEMCQISVPCEMLVLVRGTASAGLGQRVCHHQHGAFALAWSRTVCFVLF